jgi:succinate dehydrogenase / fumarate reductase membrane anchor subunit
MTRRHSPSPFVHTQGLGSAREGVAHWWTQRVTAVALVPLTLWFASALMAHASGDYGIFIEWLRAPVTTVLMVMLLIALFYHMALGLQVVVEDYVHTDWIKMPTIMMIYLGCFALAVAGIIATLRIAFGG